MRRALIAGASVLVLMTVAPSARADDKTECLDAYEKAQRVRQEGKLRESRTQLTVCAREACPASIRKDCGRWLDEIEQAIPTIILRATGAQGEDLKDVRVTMDGEEIASSLTGTALPIDPGPHKFVFTRSGHPPLTVEHVIAEGDKRRIIVMPSSSPPPATTTTTTVAPDRETPTPSTANARPVPILTYVLGGVAVAGFAGFAYFALQGSASRDDLDACRPFCDKGAIDESKQKFVIGDVFLGFGTAALIGAAVVYVTRPTRAASTRHAPWVIAW